MPMVTQSNLEEIHPLVGNLPNLGIGTVGVPIQNTKETLDSNESRKVVMIRMIKMSHAKNVSARKSKIALHATRMTSKGQTSKQTNKQKHKNWIGFTTTSLIAYRCHNKNAYKVSLLLLSESFHCKPSWSALCFSWSALCLIAYMAVKEHDDD
jgi:hypothetical protein